MPQGYQISQLYHQLVGEGALTIEADEKAGIPEPKVIGVERIHVEQDAGKLMHDQHPTMSYVDLNRSGVALMEIVSRPDMRSPAEAGVCVAAIEQLTGELPILGACLGHQAIGAALGGKVIRAKTQMHGKADVISTDERGVFTGLPRQFSVIRYHSLVIERGSLPVVLDITSTSQDGEIMGVRHRELAGPKTPLEGVQFHPESILTEHGHAMLKNFLELRS